MKRLILKLRHNKLGQGTLEYIIIAAAIVAVAVIVGKTVRTGANKNITEIANGLSAGTNSGGN